MLQMKMNAICRLLSMAFLTLCCLPAWAAKYENLNAYFVPLGEYETYYKKSYEKLDSSDYWVFEKGLIVQKLKSGEELGRALPHLIMFCAQDKRVIAINSQKYLQTITFKNIQIKDALLSFDIVEVKTGKVFEHHQLVLHHYKEFGLTFIKGLGIEMNY